MKNFSERELEILRHAVDNAENKSQREIINNPEVKKIISIVEEFITKKKCICYGGTAINNILPISKQFYNKSIELPDYDFYSTKALDHAKELADITEKGIRTGQVGLSEDFNRRLEEFIDSLVIFLVSTSLSPS